MTSDGRAYITNVGSDSVSVLDTTTNTITTTVPVGVRPYAYGRFIAGNDFDEHPGDVFRRHVWINPFHEEDMSQLVALLGAGRVMFGSDYPHPEGLAEPREFLSELAGLPQDTTARVMGRNLKELLGVTSTGTRV